jgi:thymidine phosphorylase
MSKKLAEGIDGLVLDIKVGNGAFMKTIGDATELANSLISTARAFKKKVAAFITDMNQPLGHYIGNWLEVLESIKILKGEFVPDLSTVTLTLSGAMIYLGGKAASLDEGIEISLEMIRSGKAFDKFVEMVKLQGGDVSYILKPEKYPKSKHHIRITAPASGYLKSVDNYQIGISALLLGAGRIVKEDVIDPKAGIVFHPKIGNRIKKGDPIADLYTDRKDVLKSIEEKILKSVKIVNEKTTAPKLIKKIIL